MKHLLGLLLAVWAAMPLAPARAQAGYPDHAVRIVVPFSPGGGIDVLGRTIGQKLSERWGVPAVIDNKPGASGNIGTELVARAPADGYTFLMTVNTMVITPSLIRSTPYDPVRDFAPVAPVAIGQLALVARTGLPVSTVKDLIALARATPDRLNYGSPGNGTPHHLAMELLKQRADFRVTHVPYKASAGLITDVLSGQVDCAFLPVHTILPHVKNGKLTLLAAGGLARTAVTPDTPSLAEASGIRDVDVDMWYGLYLPAGTPPELVARVNRDVNEVLALPDVRQTLSAQGLAPSGGSAASLAQTTRRDFARWATVVRDANVRAD